MPARPCPYFPHADKLPETGCVSIIGMAAAGKTTIGRELAILLDFPQLDTDHLLEATYGTRLQNITSALSKEDFLDVESLVVGRLIARRAVISTGGSVVYRASSMAHLASLGPVIYIDVPLPIIAERILRKPDRGLAVNPGQTLEDLFREREPLYKSFATHTIRGGEGQARTYASAIADWLSCPWSG
ncbi:MAG: shikimate kinase [Desulfovibrio sp.]|jgi:shikimate kinase|nr:shikimate kinase [Desulfovibrio sp.]